MSRNTDNAIHGLQEARSAIFVESGDIDENDIDDELDQKNKLESIQKLINKVEAKIKDYANN